MNLYVIVGEDDFLVAETAKKAIGAGASGLEVIDSANSTNAESELKDIAAADASFSTPPFLEPVKATWWKNVSVLPCGGKGGPSEEVKKALEKFAEKLAESPLPENQKFILSGPRLLQTSIFAKTLKGAAEMVVFPSGKPWEKARAAASRLPEMAAELGLSFAPGVADLFISRVGTDTRSLVRELEKMRDYIGGKGGTVTADCVAAVTSQGVGVEPEVWDVTDAVGARDLGKALAQLRRFEGDSGYAVFMTTVLEKFFRQLAEIKDAAERGRSGDATSGMAPFAARKILAFLDNWTLRELRVARFRFLALRERAVSSAGSVEALVATELVRACLRTAGGAA